jgi:methylenetetrahydrofolate dehydrogenase (NADP+)/methenyltetrahydrofolate cyclohydrolase
MILDGKVIAQKIKDKIARRIKYLPRAPRLAILTFGDDDASKVYVRNKLKAAEEVGIVAEQHKFTEAEYASWGFESTIQTIIDDFDGIILQLPVPDWCHERWILSMIPAEKDVDGLTTMQKGKLREMTSNTLEPCTPQGIMYLLNHYFEDEMGYGKNALVIGRSDLVGKPIAELLTQANYTVTIAHSHTPKSTLMELFSKADVVVSAAGKRDLITEEDADQFWKDNRHYPYGCLNFNRDRIIIDVSINRDENGKLCGDFSEDFKQAYSRAYTPVPGGIGPMTVAMLMWNTYKTTEYHFTWGEYEDDSNGGLTE